MRYLVFGEEQSQYPVALLTRFLRENELRSYVHGIEQDVIAYQVTTTTKAKKQEIVEYLNELLPALAKLRVEYLVVTDAGVFKTLTKSQQVARVGGYVMSCTIKDYEFMHIVYVPSPSQIIYDPKLNQKVLQGMRALDNHRQGKYLPPGSSVIVYEEYPDDLERIQFWLDKLVDTPLAIDTETYDLKHYKAGLGTISMAWNRHEGIAFSVSKDNSPKKTKAILLMLRKFFQARHAKTIYHNAAFDVGILIYQLFMTDLLDTRGLLYGLQVMLRNFDDTQLITYLATNSCVGNRLSLKEQAQEFAGNYMIDVKDISVVPLPMLLTYNLVDAMATWYVFEKHWQTIIDDDQLGIYEELFKPMLTDIIQMQLTGMPIDMEKVREGKTLMEHDRDSAIAGVRKTSEVTQVEHLLDLKWVEKRNKELKVKRVTLDDASSVFNMNSPLQIQILLHEVMGLPVVEKTDTGQPATGHEAIEHLIAHATTDAHKDLLQELINYKLVDKILGTFIPAFEQAPLASDGHHYLFGFYNIGGTLSGRLSSNGPNMQNIPSNDPKDGPYYAKMVKEMFRSPPGWLFVGLDFASLEDRISALTTKDPNKIKVYTDGYDGHSLRAFSYFGDRMPDIVDEVDSINSIQDRYKSLRQDSKAPTFALTYQGTWRTLVTNCGFSAAQAKAIEAKYHELYAVSDAWVKDKIDAAAKCGYVTIAFGLRLRTPMLFQTILGNKKTPYEATAESRTAGNALGQSYGLLNSRAAMEFNQLMRESEYRLDIRPCAQIHDAQYLLVRDNSEVLSWVNEHLVAAVQWQELPEIQHPLVKLGGELSVFYPSWAHEFNVPNGADGNTILQLARKYINERNNST